jgi:nucleoside-diphosphate-sugar epimerase
MRNFIHVEDIAKIIALVVQRRIEGMYSCINFENVSYSEIAAAAINVFKSKSTVKFMKEKADIPNNIFDFDDSLFRLIDYYPQISILLGMKKEAVYRENNG